MYVAYQSSHLLALENAGKLDAMYVNDDKKGMSFSSYAADYSWAVEVIGPESMAADGESYESLRRNITPMWWKRITGLPRIP